VLTRSEDKFVNFRQVFPQEWPANLEVNRYDLLRALDKCALSNDELHTTKIDLAEKEIKFTADDSVIKINVAMAATYSGEVKEISINSEKLLKLLHQVEQTEIKLAIHDAKRAVIITADGDAGYKGMIMPIAV
jgi:DNA polymerase III sliding clamp (beta) subunit (PCNA family)